MLKGCDIILFASQDWNSHLGVPQQIAARLAAANKVIYIDPPRSLTSARSGWRPAGGAALHQEVAAAPAVIRVTPPVVSLPMHSLPAALSSAVRVLNGGLLRGWLADVLRREGVRDPLYWVFEPAAIAHLPHLPPGPVVYDCIDDWAGYFPADGRHHRNITRMDAALLRRADIVFVGSATLLQRKGHLNRQTHVVNHAADYDHFRKAALPDTPVPDDVPPDPRPTIGLAGILDKRIDVASLATIARRRPDWRFVVVGPVQANLDAAPLLDCANVLAVGMVKVSELPRYIKTFDVCVIPYLIDEFVRSIYPLKLHEYLASGRPVVSTSVPAVLRHADLVWIGDGADGLERAVTAALGDTAADRVAARIALARQNTWEARIADKCRLLQNLMDKNSRIVA